MTDKPILFSDLEARGLPIFARPECDRLFCPRAVECLERCAAQGSGFETRSRAGDSAATDASRVSKTAEAAEGVKGPQPSVCEGGEDV